MMIDTTGSILSVSIGEEMPTVILPFLNLFADILVMFNFNTFIFFKKKFPKPV